MQIIVSIQNEAQDQDNHFKHIELGRVGCKYLKFEIELENI